MRKKVLASRVTKNPITGYNRNHSENIFLANKILTLNLGTEEKARFYIAKQKDLLYRVESGVYVSLSDFSYLNKMFVDRDMFKDFSEEDYRLFLKTYGVSIKLSELKPDTSSTDKIYALNLEKFDDYSYDSRGKDIEDYIKFVQSVNRFNSSYIRRNFKHSSINQDIVKPDIIIANSYDLDDCLERLTTDSLTGNSLSKMYSRKLFK